jgi:hypothetical protein
MDKVGSFRGLNNVVDPLRLDPSWLVQANNVDVTSTGALKRRAGYALSAAGSFTGGYSTLDHQRAYVIDGGALKTVNSPTSFTTLRTGLGARPMYWAEINDQVFYNDGISSGIILPDNTLMDWSWTIPPTPAVATVTGNLPTGTYQVRITQTLADGRVTGASDAAEITLADGQALQISSIPAGAEVYIAPANSTVFQSAGRPGAAMVWDSSPDALGVDLGASVMDPLPAGAAVIQMWGGRAHVAVPMPADNQTVIFRSQPLGFHLFNLADDFIAVSGEVLALIPTDKALVIGTDSAIYAYDGNGLTELAPYGVVPGWCWALDPDDNGKAVIWTARGTCTAMPFTNLTEGHISVAPGVQAGAVVIASGGEKRFVTVLHQGGTAFNQR